MAHTSGPRIYNLFPLLAGSMNDWRGHLPRVAAMGFDWVYLNPIQYPGFSGSLYATKDYDRLNPLFDDGSGRPMAAQVADFARDAEAHGLKVMLDLVINHTSKDAALAEAHPDWYLREADGSLYSPRAFDPDEPDNPDKATIWGDLAELDWSERPARAAMVGYFQDVARGMADMGVHGFRCDAAYKVPAEVWSAVIDAARAVDPGIEMFAETLGCRFEEVEALARAGFHYLFNSSKWWDFQSDWLMEQYDTFRHIAPSVAFPESHDTERLIAETPEGANAEALYRRQWLFAATFSSGAMMPMGFEYGFSRKLDVVTSRPDQWEAPRFDLSDFVGKVNRMKAGAWALNVEGPQTLHRLDGGRVVAFVRRLEHDPDWVLTVINADIHHPATAWGDELVELVGGETGVEITPDRHDTLDADAALGLEPAGVRVFHRAASV